MPFMLLTLEVSNVNGRLNAVARCGRGGEGGGKGRGLREYCVRDRSEGHLAGEGQGAHAGRPREEDRHPLAARYNCYYLTN